MPVVISDKVVSLNGQPTPQQSNADIVSKLEKLLDRAKTGELQGFAYIIAYDRYQTVHTDYCCGQGGMFALVAGSVELQTRMGLHMVREEDANPTKGA